MIGNLTLKGKTKEVSFDYTLGPVGHGREGVSVPLFARGTIDRKDFGITYNRKLDGSMLLDDKVEIQIEFQAVLKK